MEDYLREVVGDSAFADQIEFLLSNPNYSGKPLVLGRDKGANCHGTTMWVYGGEHIERIRKERFQTKNRSEHREFSELVFPLDVDRPYFLGCEEMHYYLNNHGSEVSRSDASLFAVYGEIEAWEGYDYETALHSGILLPDGYAFDQNDHRGEWRVVTLDTAISKYSYGDLKFFSLD